MSLFAFVLDDSMSYLSKLCCSFPPLASVYEEVVASLCDARASPLSGLASRTSYAPGASLRDARAAR